MSEVWRDIPGYEGRYQVSNMGRVRSVARRVRLVTRKGVETTRLAQGRVLRPGRTDCFGHLSVALGRNNSQCVHTLVVLAFIGPRPFGHDVAHLNGDASDNRLENLAYTTRRENNRHRVYHGRAGLTVAQIHAIRARALQGFAHGDKAKLARDLGVSPAMVSSVLKGRTYAYVA